MSELTLKTVFEQAIVGQRAIDNAKAKVNSVGTNLLALAKQAGDLESFLVECGKLEEAHKNSKRKDKTVPRCWTQAKSNIKAAHTLKLGVTNYETEGQLRKAVNETRKANKAKTEQAKQDKLTVMLAKISESFKDTNEAGRDAAADALEQAIVQMMKGVSSSRKARGTKQEPKVVGIK